MSKNIEKAFAKMQKQADKYVEGKLKEQLPVLIRLALANAEIHHVTGNTINSYAVALFHKGQFKGFYSSFQELHKPPMRVTLRKGERYDMPFYWSGEPAKGYTAPTGERNYWSQEEAEDFIGTTFPKKKGWAYIVVAAVDYARYLETRGTANVLTGLREELAGMGADATQVMPG